MSPLEVTDYLGRAILENRLSKDYSQKNLAEKARVSQEYISMLENGKRKGHQIRTLQRISHSLGMELSELLRYAEKIMDSETELNVRINS